MSNMTDSGYTTGMVAGGLVGLGIVASRAIDNAAQHAQAVGTVRRWSQALDQQRQRAVKAERMAIRQADEIVRLRQALKNAEFELSILRNA